MPNKWTTLVSRLAGLRVLVVGDISLDEYVYGKATRLSREAPVPVLELVQREYILGAAANPSRNIVAMGSHALQVGIIGNDAAGLHLRAAFQRDGISTDGLFPIEGRPTTTKTRIMAHQSPRLPQQVARIDHIDRTPLTPTEEQHILTIIREHIPHVDAVLCSDYQLGLLTPTVVNTLRILCQKHHVTMTVDTQGNSHYYRGVDLFRCNDIEASTALGIPLRQEKDFQIGLQELHSRLQARMVIVTRGPEGVSFLGDGIAYTHRDAVQVSEVYDTTGAGDTFIAIATLAMTAQIDPHIGVDMANAAAALVVRKFGNVVVTPEELISCNE
jgi:rfaE bifunctional protein kinase chain/domain